MELRIDFHSHSEASHDGRMTVDQITRIARERGLDGIAITDHDVPYCGPTEVNGVLVIPGVEFSTPLGHMLGLFFSGPLPESRELRVCADAVHAAGGITVMAHPFQHSINGERLLPVLDCLDGMEIWNGRADRKNHRANEMAAAFARQHGLRPFAGGDAHLPQEIGNGVLTICAKDKSLSAVKEALLTSEGTASGHRGKDLWVSKSQWTKLKKANAPFSKYIKWFTFTGLCLWRDLIYPKK